MFKKLIIFKTEKRGRKGRSKTNLPINGTDEPMLGILSEIINSRIDILNRVVIPSVIFSSLTSLTVGELKVGGRERSKNYCINFRNESHQNSNLPKKSNTCNEGYDSGGGDEIHQIKEGFSLNMNIKIQKGVIIGAAIKFQFGSYHLCPDETPLLIFDAMPHRNRRFVGTVVGKVIDGFVIVGPGPHRHFAWLYIKGKKTKILKRKHRGPVTKMQEKIIPNKQLILYSVGYRSSTRAVFFLGMVVIFTLMRRRLSFSSMVKELYTVVS